MGQAVFGFSFPKQLDEVFQFGALGFVAGDGAEEGGQLGQQFFVFQNLGTVSNVVLVASVAVAWLEVAKNRRRVIGFIGMVTFVVFRNLLPFEALDS